MHSSSFPDVLLVDAIPHKSITVWVLRSGEKRFRLTPSFWFVLGTLNLLAMGREVVMDSNPAASKMR